MCRYSGAGRDVASPDAAGPARSKESDSVSRMRSRRVPVLKLGSKGPGGDQKSLRLCSSSVRKRSQAFASVCKRSRVSESVAHRRESQMVAKRRTVVTSGLVSGLRVSKVSTVTVIRGVVVAKPRTVVTFGLAFGERREEKREMRGEKRGEESG